MNFKYLIIALALVIVVSVMRVFEEAQHTGRNLKSKLRESFIKGLNNYNTFGKGWLRRLNGIQYGKLIISNGKTI